MDRGEGKGEHRRFFVFLSPTTRLSSLAPTSGRPICDSKPAPNLHASAPYGHHPREATSGHRPLLETYGLGLCHPGDQEGDQDPQQVAQGRRARLPHRTARDHGSRQKASATLRDQSRRGTEAIERRRREGDASEPVAGGEGGGGRPNRGRFDATYAVLFIFFARRNVEIDSEEGDVEPEEMDLGVEKEELAGDVDDDDANFSDEEALETDEEGNDDDELSMPENDSEGSIDFFSP